MKMGGSRSPPSPQRVVTPRGSACRPELVTPRGSACRPELVTPRGSACRPELVTPRRLYMPSELVIRAGRGARYSGSGRSSRAWHSVQTHVRSTCLVRESRRSVHGITADRPHRSHRSARVPGCRREGTQGIFAGIGAILASLTPRQQGGPPSSRDVRGRSGSPRCCPAPLAMAGGARAPPTAIVLSPLRAARAIVPPVTASSVEAS